MQYYQKVRHLDKGVWILKQLHTFGRCNKCLGKLFKSDYIIKINGESVHYRRCPSIEEMYKRENEAETFYGNFETYIKWTGRKYI